MDDIFQQATPQIDPSKDYSTELIGEGKKYVDQSAAARAIMEKDAMIERLIHEKRGVETSLQEQINLTTARDRMAQLETPRQPQRQEPTPSSAPTAQPAFKAEDLERMITDKIAESEAQAKRTRNLMEVKDKLTSVYGNDYANRVKQRAQELGIGTDFLNQTAAQSPLAFFELLGLNQTQRQVPTVIPNTQVNSASFKPDHNGGKNYAYFQKIKNENKALYWSPSVQMEEWNSLKQMGEEAFYQQK